MRSTNWNTLQRECTKRQRDFNQFEFRFVSSVLSPSTAFIRLVFDVDLVYALRRMCHKIYFVFWPKFKRNNIKNLKNHFRLNHFGLSGQRNQSTFCHRFTVEFKVFVCQPLHILSRSLCILWMGKWIFRGKKKNWFHRIATSTTLSWCRVQSKERKWKWENERKIMKNTSQMKWTKK